MNKLGDYAHQTSCLFWYSLSCKSGPLAAVSAAPAPRNDAEHIPIWCTAKHNLIHTIMHSGLKMNMTSLISVYKRVTHLKVPRVQVWRWSLGSGRQWGTVSVLQGRVSRQEVWRWPVTRCSQSGLVQQRSYEEVLLKSAFLQLVHGSCLVDIPPAHAVFGSVLPFYCVCLRVVHIILCALNVALQLLFTDSQAGGSDMQLCVC